MSGKIIELDVSSISDIGGIFILCSEIIFNKFLSEADAAGSQTSLGEALA